MREINFINDDVLIPGGELDRPLISVVITAYRRDKFLLDAFDSLLEQSMDRSAFEVIIVKDFSDPAMDEYLRKNGAVLIRMADESLGRYIYEGLIRSRGEVVSFLDDDDMFMPFKLEQVAEVFKENPDLGFYHNSFITVDEGGHTTSGKMYRPFEEGTISSGAENLPSIAHRFFKVNSNVNLSCTSIKRDVLIGVGERLRQLTAGPDNFVFYAALISGRAMMSDSQKLTKYRIHDSTSHTSIRVDELASRALKFELKLLENYRGIGEMVSKTDFFRLARCSLLESKFSAYLLGDDTLKPNGEEFAAFLACVYRRRAAYPLPYILGAVLKMISPTIGSGIYRKYLRSKVV